MSDEVVRDFRSSLNDLTFNSKPQISMLTMLAEDNSNIGEEIVHAIEDRLKEASPAEKLPALYLIDSIIKNVPDSNYLELFSKNIATSFKGVFEKVDERTRQAMFKLRQTWAELFLDKKMYVLDVKVQAVDPAWPILASPPEASSPNIHVNPRFLMKQSTPSPGPQLTLPSVPAVVPVAVPVAVPDFVKIAEEQRKKEQEEAEAQMRAQLLAKQQELLKLEQQRLELELAEARARLAAQALQTEQQQQKLQATATAPTATVAPTPARDPRIANRDPRLASRDPRCAAPSQPVQMAIVPPASVGTTLPSSVIPAKVPALDPKVQKQAAVDKPQILFSSQANIEAPSEPKRRPPLLPTPGSRVLLPTPPGPPLNVVGGNQVPPVSRQLVSRQKDHSSLTHDSNKSTSLSAPSHSADKKSGDERIYISKEPDSKHNDRDKQDERRTKSRDRDRDRNRDRDRDRDRGRSTRHSDRRSNTPDKEKDSRTRSRRDNKRSRSRSRSPRGSPRSSRSSKDDRRRRSGSKERDDTSRRGKPSSTSSSSSSTKGDDKELDSRKSDKAESSTKRKEETAEEKKEKSVDDQPPAKKSKSEEAPKLSDDLLELFGGGDKDYRPKMLAPPTDDDNQAGPGESRSDGALLTLPSPSHDGWAKFKASRPEDFPFKQPRLNLKVPPLGTRTSPLQTLTKSGSGQPFSPEFAEQLKIPAELMVDRIGDILREADMQLKCGKLSHDQHQDLLKQLNELYQLQKLKQDIQERRRSGELSADTSPSATDGNKRPALLPAPPIPPALLSPPLDRPPAGPSTSNQDAKEPIRPPPPPPPPLLSPVGFRVPPFTSPGRFAGMVPNEVSGRPQAKGVPTKEDLPGLDTKWEKFNYDKEAFYVPLHDPRWYNHYETRNSRGEKPSHELVIGNKMFEFPLDHSRRINLGGPGRGLEVIVLIDSKSREVLVDGKCYYQVGEPSREVVVGGRRFEIHLQGPAKSIWIDNYAYEIRSDSPPEKILVGGKEHDVQIDSIEGWVIFDSHKVIRYGAKPSTVLIAGTKHEIRFEAPPKPILVDSRLCEIRYDGKYPYIVIDGKEKMIRFDGEPREVFIDGKQWTIPVDKPRRARIGGKAFTLALGGPGFEIIMNGKWHEIKFDGKEKPIKFGSKVLRVKLNGPPPQVKIVGEFVRELEKLDNITSAAEKKKTDVDKAKMDELSSKQEVDNKDGPWSDDKDENRGMRKIASEPSDMSRMPQRDNKRSWEQEDTWKNKYKFENEEKDKEGKWKDDDGYNKSRDGPNRRNRRNVEEDWVEQEQEWLAEDDGEPDRKKKKVPTATLR